MAGSEAQELPSEDLVLDRIVYGLFRAAGFNKGLVLEVYSIILLYTE